MNLIQRAKNIILTPKGEWLVIDQEETTISQLITTYLLPLSLIPTVFSFISYGLIGYSVPYIGPVAGTLTLGITRAVVAFISPTLVALISAFIISSFATSFGAQKDFLKSFRMVTYSYTPGLLAGIFYIRPSLSILTLLVSIYGLYVLYLGFVPMLKTPEDKVTGYFIVSLITIVISMVVIGLILAAIVAAFALTGTSVMMHHW